MMTDEEGVVSEEEMAAYEEQGGGSGDEAVDDDAAVDGATDEIVEEMKAEAAAGKSKRGRKPSAEKAPKAAKGAKAPKPEKAPKAAKGKKPKAGDVVTPDPFAVPPGKGVGRQTRLPGTESPDRIPEVEALAARYVDVRDERMKLTKKEVTARDLLLEEMIKRGLTKYACDLDDLDVIILPARGPKLKVQRRDEPDDGDDD